MDGAAYDALIVAGGSARRLGGADKPALDVGGQSLLARVVGATADAEQLVVVGPRRPLPERHEAVTWCVEDPAGGGPVAAIATGLLHTRADVVVVLAADLPWVAPAVPVLRATVGAAVGATVGAADVAVLVDGSGRRNHLAAAWRRTALVAAVDRLGEPSGARVRDLFATVRVAAVPDPHGWGRDCDTWDDVAAARSAAQDASRSSPA
ncbi:molybdenum cofactor guanylyltransferase [uncultured Jatrophihabitans sp.]|uniref:molybdenum cofactor guanylyltransferase n=1 Tax=uncultured Jatrophihabitans sp. TaxID=1610747 RepID=UPI0035CB0BD9